MKELLQAIAKSLVTKPDAVALSETQGDSITFFQLRVAKEDLGRIIGKHRLTIKAIRAILYAVAARNRRKIIIEIVR